MSEDFISDLRSDLEEALERYERRSPRRRLGAGLRSGAWRLRPLAGAAAVAALVAGALLVARAFGPEPLPVRPRVVEVLPIGGTPTDAVFADGSLWATDLDGAVVRVDAEDRRVIARIRVPGSPGSIATDAGSVWALSTLGHCDSRLVRIDAAGGRVVSRTATTGDGVLAATTGALWVPPCSAGRDRIDRLDRTGTATGRVQLANADGLVTAGGVLWALSHNGTVAEIDPADGGVVRRWPQLAPLADPNTTGANALAADGNGVWVISTGRAEILRIDGGRAVRRFAVPRSARPLITRRRDGVWIATADRLGADNRLLRIDPETGEVTATLEFGSRQPIALVPTDHQLCVVTSDGSIAFVGS